MARLERPVDLSALPVGNLDPARVAQAELAYLGAPYAVHVHPLLGSDANNGRSAGQAFQTLAKAISTLQVAGHGGVIRVGGVSTGNMDISAPLAFVRGIAIVADTPDAITIRRAFGTPNGRSVWDAVSTAAGTAITSATAAFVAGATPSGDVNRIACLYGAGVGGGTFYDFIASRDSATQISTTATTAIARNATTDPRGVKLSIVGDWNRVVTDAAMAEGTSVVTSATATWTDADIGTELVIAAAGQGGQALRTAILSRQSATQVTVIGVCSKVGGVSAARCAIGVNFGDLLTYHVGQQHLTKVILTDESGTSNRIGAAIKLIADDKGAGVQSSPSVIDLDTVTITSTGAGGAWEHEIDADGSWNQNTSGPGIRRITGRGLRLFGARAVGETVRLASCEHWNIVGEGIVGNSPTAIAQGILILDPQKTSGGQYSTGDVNFSVFEGLASYLYVEGQDVSYVGGSVKPTVAASGRHAIELSTYADNCYISTTKRTSLTGVNADEYDAGTNNRIETTSSRRHSTERAHEVLVPVGYKHETFSAIGFSPANVTTANTGLDGTGTMYLQAIWLPGGLLVSKLAWCAGNTSTLAWGSGYTGPHFFYGLYDPDGNLLCQSADTGGTQTWTSSALNSLNVAAAARVPRTGVCYMALLVNSGSGGSGFTGPPLFGLACSPRNVSPLLNALVGTGQTALPPTTTIPPASGGKSFQIYAAVG